MVFFQARKKMLNVQNFILKVINNNCPELKSLFEGPRRDKRINLSIVVLLVPLVDGKPRASEAFHVVTREFSAAGLGVILDRQLGLDELIIGIPFERDMTFMYATAKHLNPMGGGFYHLGLELSEIVPESKYPQLVALKF